MKPIILFADPLHINERNFSSFHAWLAATKAQVHVVDERKSWISLYGEYEHLQESLRAKVDLLALLPPDRLYRYVYHGVNLFAASRAEIMARVVVRRDWHKSAFPDSHRGVFDKLYAETRSVVLYNMAAAMDWIDFWRAKLPSLSPQPTHVCLFSGSLIYTRTLTELLRMSPTRVMMMESFFTGNEYYLEERYSPLPNASDLGLDAVYRSIQVPAEPDEYDRARIHAVNKVLLSENKNAPQPVNSKDLPFKDGAPLVVVLGQVVNDFSLLNYGDRGISSVAFYRALIEALVSRGCNVVFKDHPWELKKTHVKRPFTKELLSSWLASKDQGFRSRVFIDSELNIHQLFKRCDAVAGLNSQGLIEAAFGGMKPAQFGNAFYGRKGFTLDYSLGQVDEFAQGVASGALRSTLSLDEMDKFELFLVKALQCHLVSNTAPSDQIRRISAIMIRPSGAALVHPGKKAEKPAAEKSSEDAIPNIPGGGAEVAALPKATEVAPTPPGSTTPARAPTTNLAKEVAPSTRTSPAKTTPQIRAALRGSLSRKLNKLLTQPRQFFVDFARKRRKQAP